MHSFLLAQGADVSEQLQACIAAHSRFVFYGPRQFDEHIFDTADFALYRSGHACCLRESLGQGRLTFSDVDATGRGADGGVFVQQEWAEPAVSALISVQSWPDGPVRNTVLKVSGATPLVRQGRLRSVRHIYASPADPLRPALWIDRVAVIDVDSGEARSRFLTISYCRGAADDRDFDGLHRHLLADFSLRPLVQGSFSRCLRATGRLLPLYQARRFQPLAQSAAYAELLKRHCANQVALLHYWHDVAAEGVEPEGVHQMRVAIRRIRSALRTSRDHLKPKTYSHLQNELRWLGQRLGAVRELDVLGGWLEQAQLAPDDKAMLIYWQSDINRLREQAHRSIAALLSGDRVMELEATLLQSLDKDKLLKKNSAAQPPAKIARKVIAKTVRKTARDSLKLREDCAPEALHELRIRYKRLRYTLDFLLPVSALDHRQLTKTCKKVQKILGEHQDLHDRAERIRRYASSPAALAHGQEFVFFLGRLFASQMQAMQSCREQFFQRREEFVARLEEITRS